MERLPNGAALCIVALMGAAVGVLGWSAPLLVSALPAVLPAVLLAFPCLVLARAYSLRLSPKTKINLFATIAFALVLVAGVPVAVWAGAVSCLAAALLPRVERCRWYQTAFNAANYTVSIALSGLCYALVGRGAPLLASPRSGLAVCAGAGVFFLVNVGLLSMLLGFVQHPEDRLRAWLTAFRVVVREYVALLALGVISAVVGTYAPLAMPLLLFPLAALYGVLKSTLETRRETRRAFEELADEVDRRLPTTAGHSRRVARYVARYLETVGGLSASQVEQIVWSARVHDIGKKYVTLSVTDKTLPLRGGEQDELRNHASYGADLLRSVPAFGPIADIVLHHHEHVDGSGFPDALAGDAIPFGSRVIRISEAFDAVLVGRSAAHGRSFEAAASALRARSGWEFDATIVEAFLHSIGPRDVAHAMQEQTAAAIALPDAEARASGRFSGASVA